MPYHLAEHSLTGQRTAISEAPDELVYKMIMN